MAEPCARGVTKLRPEPPTTAKLPHTAHIREAELPGDLDAVVRLWLAYLTWGNDGLEKRYGFRLPVREAVEHDLRSVAKFQRPDGRLLLAFEGDLIASEVDQTVGRMPPNGTTDNELTRRSVHRNALRQRALFGIMRVIVVKLIMGRSGSGVLPWRRWCRGARRFGSR